MAIHKGNIPDLGKGWHQAGCCVDGDKVSWIVFRREQAHSSEWVYYKIVADGKAKNKANYWLAKNEATGQIGFSRDFAVMRENRPELHNKVEAIMGPR